MTLTAALVLAAAGAVGAFGVGRVVSAAWPRLRIHQLIREPRQLQWGTDAGVSAASRASAVAFFIDRAASSAAARSGGRFLEFDSLDRWTVRRGVGPYRFATASVTWRVSCGGSTTRQYRLTLIAIGAGDISTWRVQTVTAAHHE